jgi:dihydropyrimidinase
VELYFIFPICRQIGRNLIIPGGTRIIDARGKYVIPGNLYNFTWLSALKMLFFVLNS